jgi:hypothetical protein
MTFSLSSAYQPEKTMTTAEDLRSTLDGFEKNFAAIGLAEGDPDIARNYLNTNEAADGPTWLQTTLNKVKDLLYRLEISFAAAAMAEGGTDLAVAYLDTTEDLWQAVSFDTFMRDIGLQHTPVQYGIAAFHYQKAS